MLKRCFLQKAGKVAGYSMAWGYWAANWNATASVIISFAGYLSTFFPVLQSKQILFSINGFSLELGKGLTFLVCSLMLWGIQYILSQNIDRAGNMNLLATIAKIIGFTMFIVITLFIFNASNFGDGQTFMNEAGQSISLGGQINSAAIATLWAFIGIESAVMLSNRAKSQRDVKSYDFRINYRSSYLHVNYFTYNGSSSARCFKRVSKPLVDALNLAIGNKGAYIMALLALISLFGSTVGWIVVSSEVPYQAAKMDFS